MIKRFVFGFRDEIVNKFTTTGTPIDKTVKVHTVALW